jgi:hypothetical protein
VLDRAAYQGRLWVTRARPKIDRLSSAWLIRHSIDAAAKFGFLGEGEKPPRGSISFDTFGGDFTHEGDDCSFEVLVRRFGIVEPGILTLARVIHNADLQDEKFDRQEHVGLAAVVAGLVANIPDDQALVLAGFPVFAALKTAFDMEAATATAPASAKARPRRSRRSAGRRAPGAK